MRGRGLRWLGILLAAVTVLLACGGAGPAIPLKSDLGLGGLQVGVVYNLQGPAGSDQLSNWAEMRGVNDNSPERQLRTTFGQMSGTKTQDVEVSLPDGRNVQALGMSKIARGIGFSRYITVESATYWAADSKGHVECAAKIRLDFMRNLVQIFDPNKVDYDSLWYYKVPCVKNETGQLSLDIQHASLIAVVLNEVWQFRLAWGSYFFNWGHSVTSIGGPAASLTGGWWGLSDVAGSNNTAMGAARIATAMVKDLQSSSQPWLEYTPGGQFARSGAYLIYSAGDADQYNPARFFLNRQSKYVVAYRPDPSTPWDVLAIDPQYNLQWNDAGRLWATAQSWGSAPFDNKLDSNGLPKDPNDNVVVQLEKIGWMNAPNASLDQVRFISPNGHINWTVTVRAYVGANDSLILFGPVNPNHSQVASSAPDGVKVDKPTLYDSGGKPLSTDQQWTDQQWAQFQKEATVWNWLQENPRRIGADLAMQYRFRDNSTWVAQYCSDSNNDTYVCGYTPIQWNLSASYYTNGQVRRPWLSLQLLGEVGMRTLGFSYVSGRFQGTGVNFALAQQVFAEKYYNGFDSDEDPFIFDSRDLQLPYTLAEAWKSIEAA